LQIDVVLPMGWRRHLQIDVALPKDWRRHLQIEKNINIPKLYYFIIRLSFYSGKT
jgi:hypothetical protein